MMACQGSALRPDVIAEAKMVNVMSLMGSGAYSLRAQTIMPSITLPAHASMLVGTCPAKHIVRWNEYVPENGFARGADIFDLAQAAGFQTAMVVGKEKLRQITEPASTDYFAFVDESDKILDSYSIEELAIDQVQAGFNLMLKFLYCILYRLLPGIYSLKFHYLPVVPIHLFLPSKKEPGM